MVKVTRVIILLIFVFITTVCAVPNPTLLGGKGLSGLLKGKSDCDKPKEPEHCDGGKNSRASAVAISSAKSDGGGGAASAKSVAIAQSDSGSNDDDCDD